MEAVTSHRVFTAERGRVRTYAQRVDDLLRRGETAAGHRHDACARGRCAGLRERLEAFRLDRQLAARRERVLGAEQRLRGLFARRVETRRAALAGLLGKLDTLSPLGVLARGYALVWEASGRRLLRDAAQAAPGDLVKIRLHEGALARHRHFPGDFVTETPKPEAAPKFEEALKELEDVVARLEKGELALEESLRLYERGIASPGSCHAKLEEAEGKIEVLMKDARGEAVLDAKGRPRTKPFELDEPE